MDRCPPVAAACRTASAARDLLAALRAASDRGFILRSAAWSVGAFLAFGLVSAIIPNPVFGRSVPPEPFAYAVWILSAPLMGLIAATYGRHPLPAGRAAAAPIGTGGAPAQDATRAAGAAPLGPGPSRPRIEPATQADSGRGSTTATVGSMAAFVAIGCPLCNKIALLLLGASGALTVFAPLQPVIGAASLILLVVTLGWRLRIVATGGSCTLAPTA